jgi:hypothetical protein
MKSNLICCGTYDVQAKRGGGELESFDEFSLGK